MSIIQRRPLFGGKVISMGQNKLSFVYREVSFLWKVSFLATVNPLYCVCIGEGRRIGEHDAQVLSELESRSTETQTGI